MSALWQFGTVPLYVSDEDVSRELKRAELFILDSTLSSYHYFGAGSEHRTIKGLVIGSANKNQLITYAIGDTAQTLITPWATLTNIKINGTPKLTAKQYAGGFIDGVTYSVTDTVIYEFELEMIQT